MKVKVHAGLAVADAVLLRLRKIRKPKLPEGAEVLVTAWSNCREQGYHICAYGQNRAVCVAESRGSDQILVVAGESKAFDNQTNQPNEFIWDNNRTFYSPGCYEEAARRIAGILAGTVDVAVEKKVPA